MILFSELDQIDIRVTPCYSFIQQSFVGVSDMPKDKLMEQLIQLNPLEEKAKAYRDACGKDLEYGKYILLTRYAVNDLPSLTFICSPAFEAESKKLALQFASQYHKDGLTNSDFINQDCEIEVEKLLRYVDIPEHHHEFFEMVYVLSGTCYHTIMGNTYEQKQGSFTFIVSHTPHELHAAPDCLCLTAKIRAETFLNFHIPNMPYFATPICFDCGEDSFMRDTLLAIYEQQENASCYHDEIISLLFQAMLTYCMPNYRDTLTFLYSGTPLQGKMLEIVNYMFENYQTITLKGLSQHFGYSESYLCRLFKSSGEASFSTIMRTFKLDRAQKLLQTTDLKLDDICESVGYSDTPQFIRDFKKQYGITPAKYRKQLRHP